MARSDRSKLAKPGFNRLRDREWHEIGPLFNEIETQIPFHLAMRHMFRKSPWQTGAGEQMPNAGDARWVLFLQGLATIGVENPAGSRSRKWRDKVRLRYLPDQLCKDCGGSVIKASWAAKTPACLRCRVAPAPTPPTKTLGRQVGYRRRAATGSETGFDRHVPCRPDIAKYDRRDHRCRCWPSPRGQVSENASRPVGAIDRVSKL